MKTTRVSLQSMALLAAAVAALFGLAFALSGSGSSSATNGCNTVLAGDAYAGADTIYVSNKAGCDTGDWVVINSGGGTEECQQLKVDVIESIIGLAGVLAHDHADGETIAEVDECPAPPPEECNDILDAPASAGDDWIDVEYPGGCDLGDFILINPGADTEECHHLLDIDGDILWLAGVLADDHADGETIAEVDECPGPTPEPTEPPTPGPTETPTPGRWECGTYGDLEPWPEAEVILNPDSGPAGTPFEVELTNVLPSDDDDQPVEVLWAWDAEEQGGELIGTGAVPQHETATVVQAAVPEWAEPPADVVAVCWWHSVDETWYHQSTLFQVGEGEPSETPTPEPTPIPTPTPTAPDRPDLDIFFIGKPYVNEDDQLLVIQARVRNLGAGRSTGTVVRARSLDADWQGEERVPGLDRGESEEVTIQLDIREDVADQTHRFLVTVDPEDDIEEEDEGNNSASREVEVPLLPPDDEGGDDDGPLTLVLAIAAGVTIGGTVTIAGVTFTVRHTIKIRRRKRWQKEAKEDELPDTCKPSTHYCRKIQIELKLARRAITQLTLVAHGPVSGEGTREGQVRGEVVEGLNEALRAHRRREKREQVQRLVEPVAKTLSQQLVEWLGPEAAPRDVSVAAHLKGGAVTFKFILYHCSTDNVWEKEDEWEEKFEDERDETVTTVRGLDPTERVAPELTQQLMQFIEKL